MIPINVRTGVGTIASLGLDEREFTDTIETVWRIPRKHTGWESVRYKGKRYQLFGGCYVNWFICLNSPIKGREK